MSRFAITPFALLAVLALAACKQEQVLYTTEGEKGPGENNVSMADGTPVTPPMMNTNAGTVASASPDVSEAPAPPVDRLALSDDAELQPVTVAGLTFDIPASWQTVPQGQLSPMRAAQANLPAVGGGERGGELVVFHFGAGQGGGTQANIDRWVGQIQLDAGTTPIVYNQVRDGLMLTELYCRGTLLPSTMGTGPTEAQPGSALVGLIVEGGPDGNIFIKVTGDAGTLDAAAPAFATMVDSMRK